MGFPACIILFLLQNQTALLVALFLIILTGIIIFLSCILRRYYKNKQIIFRIKGQLQKIQKANEQIEKQSKEKDIFYTGFFHDVKIPFSIIRNSFTAYLENHGKKDDNSQIEHYT